MRKRLARVAPCSPAWRPPPRAPPRPGRCRPASRPRAVRRWAPRWAAPRRRCRRRPRQSEGRGTEGISVDGRALDAASCSGAARGAAGRNGGEEAGAAAARRDGGRWSEARLPRGLWLRRHPQAEVGGAHERGGVRGARGRAHRCLQLLRAGAGSQVSYCDGLRRASGLRRAASQCRGACRPRHRSGHQAAAAAHPSGQVVASLLH
mmetsp:Transcript_96269/g.310626  ORF Transcript_96269/g.310626 Transcript_96269/m.310626 type:complete len:206 (-) Transcript_96269:409-1026(-)